MIFRYIVSGCETGKLFMFSSTSGKHLDVWENRVGVSYY